MRQRNRTQREHRLQRQLELADLSTFVPASWTTVAINGTFVLLLLYTLSLARNVIQPIVMAVFLSFLLRPVVRKLGTWGLPAPIGASMVLLAFLSLAVAGATWLADPAVQWLHRAPDSVPEIRQKLERLLRPAANVTNAAAQVDKIAGGAPDRSIQTVELKSPGVMDTVVAWMKPVLGGAVLTFGFLYFFLASGNRFLRRWVESAKTLTQKKRAVAISDALAQTLSIYLMNVTMINIGLGLVTGLWMAALHMPTPILWGVLGGVLNFIPYLGALTGVGIFGVVGLLQFDSLGHALLPALGYWAVTVVEGGLITPTVLGRQFALSPVMVFGSLVFWGWLWGIPGTLLAVPLLMTLKILCDHSQPLKTFGRFLGP
ncbi:MAG: AI-2E family transporter [Candidatus Omnitrophota bacterium]|nr:AI-2E family transporter [Candidatus Omnitrophota bacterium]